MSKSDQLFSELLYVLHHNAFNALEKINVSDPSKSDLTHVRQLIDMVVMLKEKTKGNLTEELNQIQTMMLKELESKYKQTLNTPSNNESA
jgi:hypothetical protein